MAERIIAISSPKPEKTEPIETVAGFYLTPWQTSFTPDDQTSDFAREMLSQGWTITRKHVSGGTFVHHSDKDTRALRMWGVYNGVMTTPGERGGVTEKGNIYYLLDDNKIKINPLNRTLGVEEEFYDFLALKDDPEFMEKAQALMGRRFGGIDPQMFEWIVSKWKQPLTVFDPTVTISQSEREQVVTLNYLEATRPLPIKRFFTPKSPPN